MIYNTEYSLVNVISINFLKHIILPELKSLVVTKSGLSGKRKTMKVVQHIIIWTCCKFNQILI